MAISYLGNVKFSTANPSANYNISFSGLSPAAGDLAIVHISIGSPSDITIGMVTSGYTLVAELYSNDSNDTNFAVYYKIIGSGETSVEVSPIPSSNNPMATIVQLYRGVSSTTPMDVTRVTATGQNSGNPGYPAGITPITAGAIVLAVGASSYGAGTAAQPGGYSNADSEKFSGVNETQVVVSSKSRVSGIESPAARSGISTSTAHSRASMLIALRPAPPVTSNGSFLLFMQ